jgi:hypothetical protein
LPATPIASPRDFSHLETVFLATAANHLKINHNPNQARAPPAKHTVGFCRQVRLMRCVWRQRKSSSIVMLTLSSFQPLSNAEQKMFVCEICKTVVPAGISAQKVTLESRAVHYPCRDKVHPPAIDVDNKKKLKSRRSRRLTAKELEKWSDDPGGHGLEIVREGLACKKCANQLSLVNEHEVSAGPIERTSVEMLRLRIAKVQL